MTQTPHHTPPHPHQHTGQTATPALFGCLWGTEHPPSQAGRWLLHCAVLCSGPLHCAEGGNFPLPSLEEGPGVLKKYLEMFLLPFQSSCLDQGSDVDPPPPFPVEPRRGLGGMLEAEWGTRRFEMFTLSAQVPQSRQGFGHPMVCSVPSSLYSAHSLSMGQMDSSGAQAVWAGEEPGLL